MPAQLRISGLTKRFDGLMALDSVDLSFAAGERVGLIGPNGSGKTTLLNIVSGYYGATAGGIEFEGRSVLGQPAHRLVRAGIGRSFQVTKIFRRLTVLENMLVAGFSDARADRAEVRDKPWRSCATSSSSGSPMNAHRRCPAARASFWNSRGS